MLTIQTWQPDTCGCLLHQAFDDEAPDPAETLHFVTEEEAAAIHEARHRARPGTTRNPRESPQPLSNACQVHAHLSNRPVVKVKKRLASPLGEIEVDVEYTPTSKEVHDAVKEENTRKNHALLLAVTQKLGVGPDDDIVTESRKKLGLHPTNRLSRREERDLNDYIQDLYDSVEWEFDQSRRLLLKTGLANQPDKTSVQTHANNRLGLGKVLVS